jgi:hypothetical protein
MFRMMEPAAIPLQIRHVQRLLIMPATAFSLFAGMDKRPTITH